MKLWKDGTDCSIPLKDDDEDEPVLTIGGGLSVPVGCGDDGIFQFAVSPKVAMGFESTYISTLSSLRRNA